MVFYMNSKFIHIFFCKTVAQLIDFFSPRLRMLPHLAPELNDSINNLSIFLLFALLQLVCLIE